MLIYMGARSMPLASQGWAAFALVSASTLQVVRRNGLLPAVMSILTCGMPEPA
jgi:hypothetical protein